jgi:hypothetical protein
MSWWFLAALLVFAVCFGGFIGALAVTRAITNASRTF